MSLVSLLSNVLSSVVGVYSTAGVALPERQYWTLASAPADCEQVVVIFIQAYVGPPGDQAARPSLCDGPKSAALQVVVTREIPVVSVKGKAPEPAQIEAAAEWLAVDAWLLLDAAASLEQWDANGGYGLGVIATVDAGEPQGGFQSVTLNVTMAIP
jgi:hypothetical protein